MKKEVNNNKMTEKIPKSRTTPKTIPAEINKASNAFQFIYTFLENKYFLRLDLKNISIY